MLKGIAASAGISIAKAYKLESPKVEIVKKEGDPAAEVEKFNAALEKTKKDIEGVKERAAKRLAKCTDIASAAAEQCGRAVVPSISFMPLAQALELEDEARFILAPGAASAPKLSGLTSCTFAVGPEGGFDDAEIALACEKGWQCALIGPRVLRTETAAIVFASLVGAASGDLRIA